MVVNSYDALRGLLQPGRLWPPGGKVKNLLEGFGDEFTLARERAEDLIEESYPATTNELLADFERVLALPACGIEATFSERRAAVVAKLNSTGGQSKAYFIAVAAALGYEVTITEYTGFSVGRDGVGDSINGDDQTFVWTINAIGTPPTYLRVGTGGVGEPLVRNDNGNLECTLAPMKPSHTILQFTYSAEPPLSVLAHILVGMSEGVIELEADGVTLLVNAGAIGEGTILTDGATLTVLEGTALEGVVDIEPPSTP